MQHFLKSSSGTTGTKIVPAEFLGKLFVSVYYSEASFNAGFRGETFASFAAGFVEKIRFSRMPLLPDGLPVTSRKGRTSG
jgi:hypothetical protein